MFHSLYRKLIAGYILFGILGFLTIALLSDTLTRQFLVRSTADSLYTDAAAIASHYSNIAQAKTTDLALAAARLESAAECTGTEAWIIDPQGKIAAADTDSRIGAVISDFDPTDRENRRYDIGRFYNTFQEDCLSVTAPITGNMTTYGYVALHLPMSLINRKTEQILHIIYITAVVLYLLSFLILRLFRTQIYRPLKQITYAARQYADGNMKHSITIKNRDEIGTLADTLNYMASKLGAMEEYQKTFIANVSHDFRSPLTSIKGYLEAMLDGTIPPDLYPHYLEILISETNRLTKLTDGMLTLGTLDDAPHLVRTSFDINRTIRETAASFEGQCDRRGITFSLTFSDEIQMVLADLGRIQQVLYNLVDNAIKFSHDQSTIYITAIRKNDKVQISVRDTGIGIPQKSQSRIWERFYKSDASRGKDKKGTGLGLSIVKEILQAHGENIDVISTEGVGSEFIFTLPRPRSS